jgi:SAM-dependent methyltransferase
MDWPSARSAKPAPPRAAPAERRAERHRSLALRALLQELPGDRSSRVLDLGSASGRNLDFLSQFASRIQFEDLYASLPTADGEAPESPPPFGRLLGLSEAARFDVILLWDLLDYLDRDSIRALVAHLARFCRPGSLLLAFSSNQKEIPEQPVRFRFVDSETLEYDVASSRLRPGPRYVPRDIAHMFAGFRVQNSYLLKNGIQEYVFARE